MSVEVPTRLEFALLAARVSALEKHHGEIIIDPPPPPPPPPGGELLIDRPFVTEQEIAAFHWVNSMVYDAADPRSCHYDASIGGAACPIIAGESMSSLRNDRAEARAPAPLTGRVRVEWQFYVPQSFYDLPWGSMNWNTMKTFRIFNNAKRETTAETSGTMNLLMYANTMWFREAGGFPLDFPGVRDGGGSIDIGYYPPADTWVAFAVVYDYDAGAIEIYIPDGRVLVVPVARVPPVDNVAPILHSTSRSHGGAQDQVPPTFLGYRAVRLVQE